jgi:sugar lactone lactonase YvrE
MNQAGTRTAAAGQRTLGDVGREISRRIRRLLGRRRSVGVGQAVQVGIGAHLPAGNAWDGIVHAAGLAAHRESGVVFASDPLAHCVYRLRFDPDRPRAYVIEAIFGERREREWADTAGFNNPRGLALDLRGNLWIADTGNHRVIRLDGAITRERADAPDAIVGQIDQRRRLPGCAADRLCAPANVAVGPDGALWIADTENHRVLAFAAPTLERAAARADLVLGQPDFTTCQRGRGAAALDEPSSVCVSQSGEVWIGDSGNLRVVRHDAGARSAAGQAANGVLGALHPSGVGAGGWTDRTFGYNEFIAIDHEGCLWLSDPDGHRVMWWEHAALKPDGAPADGIADRVEPAGSGRADDLATLSWPAGLAPTGDGAILVADAGNGRLVRFAPA